MESKLLSSYYFLAALAENNSDIYDSVYVPLCKRCLFRISAIKKEGTHIDVQRQLYEDYGLTVPEEIVRQLIVRIGSKLSYRERRNYGFTISNRGRNFKFDEFSYNKIEETYESIRRGANALEEAFQDYLKAEEIDSEIPFQNFIDSNKQKLSSYFTGEGSPATMEEVYLPHAKFLRRIEHSHHELYKAAEKSYLGSIIAAYFESGVNVEAKQDSGVVYYLDTRVVFEILDLQDPESTKPARDLLSLIKSTGGRPKVLSITIDEITKILKKEVSSFNLSNPTTTIGDACKRRHLKKLELLDLQGNLSKRLEEEYGIKEEPLSELKIREYHKSEDVDNLKNNGYALSNARHDVAAYLAVRDHRSIQTLVQKQDYWFVTVNGRLSAFNKKVKTGAFPEIILSSELTSLLFLRNPQQYARAVSSKGLGSLIALTLTEEFADRDLINEFDHLVKSKVDVTDEEYNLLIDYLATESTSRLHKLIDDVGQKNDGDASRQVHEIVNRARVRKEQEAQLLSDFEADKDKAVDAKKEQEKRNEALEQQLSKSEKELSSVASLLKQKSEENEILKREKKQNERWLFMLIGLIVVALGYVLLQNECIKVYAGKVIKWIMGGGGLWAFGNFILNIWSKVNK